MRLSDLITEVREAASAQTSNRWSDTNVARILNVQHRSLTRKTVETNQRYHNHTFQLAASAGRVKHTNVITYRLPSWVMKVQSVRYGTTTPTTSGLRDELPRVNLSESNGWQHSANGEFQLVGWSAGVDLELDVAKLPALLTKGTLPTPGSTTASQMLLDADASVDPARFPHEVVKDAYAGALFEITGPASGRVGQLLRCVASTPNLGGTLKQTLLTMEEAWASAPIASDTYEMHAELQTEHCRLLVLLAVRAMLAQERNVEGIQAISGELGEQWALFLTGIALRDQVGPHLVVESLPSLGVSPSIYEMELL